MIDIIGIFCSLWKFFWSHDQFFAILFVGWWWLVRLKKSEHRLVIRIKVYDEALEVFLRWVAELHSINRSTESDEQKRDERLKLTGQMLDEAYKAFDKLSIFGSPKVKSWIKEKKKSSIMSPPQPWVTDKIVEDFVYLLSIELGMVSILERIRRWLKD